MEWKPLEVCREISIYLKDRPARIRVVTAVTVKGLLDCPLGVSIYSFEFGNHCCGVIIMNDDELARLAREEILRETQRASARVEQIGPQGWKKCPVLPTNKRFLRNTLMSSMSRSKPLKRSHNKDCDQGRRRDRSHSLHSFSNKRNIDDEVNSSSNSREHNPRRDEGFSTVQLDTASEACTNDCQSSNENFDRYSKGET